MPWWETSQWDSRRYLAPLIWQQRRPHWQHSQKPLTYTADDQPSNAQHNHCLDTIPLNLVPPDCTLPRWKSMIHPMNTVRSPTLAISWLSCYINSSTLGTNSPPLEPATHPPTHITQLAEGLWHLAVELWICLNPQPKEEPMHTTMQANITMTLLQDIPTLAGEDSSKLEGCFIDIETTTNNLTRSHTHLAEAKTCGLTQTLIHRALQPGKPWDTRISNNNNLPDKATSTVPLQCPSTY